MFKLLKKLCTKNINVNSKLTDNSVRTRLQIKQKEAKKRLLTWQKANLSN
jgi:hypothetical protein